MKQQYLRQINETEYFNKLATNSHLIKQHYKVLSQK